MKITDLLKPCSIELNGRAASKEEVICKMVDLMAASGNIRDKETYKAGVFKRESEGTTGIGEGIAIPHAKTDAVQKPGLAAMVIQEGTDYDSLDGEPVQLLFLIAAADTEDNVHLEVLSRLSMLLMDETFKEHLIHAKSVKEFLKYIDEAENVKEEQEQKKEQEKTQKQGYDVLAVTACPTGIAHTYMAAESLENTAKEMGCSIKVETNGSGGDKNVLTAEEIAQCKCIIIAADKEVKMARFDGRPLIVTKVADGIHKPKELIEKALSGTAAVYHSNSKDDISGSGIGEEKLGRKIYKALMNGVSHMLPFVIGGGILIALSYICDGANAGTDVFGTGTALARFLNLVGNVSFGMMFPILAGYIAMAIADRPALMPGIVGGLLAKAGTSVTVPEEQWISSGFFGALIAGFLAGVLMLLLKRLLEKLPRALEGTKPVLLYPFFGVLLMGAIMIFVVNPPVGAFNSWLNQGLASMGEGSKVLLGIFLGGMMAIDFGGPFNKAAYVFGTASIASGQFDIMAAVMAGGMVPPIGIALATTFFKNRFTKSERQTTVTNYIMGLSFITEGAIPFAASDPLRIIPPSIVGAAAAGALSMLFGCGSRAPHGGIFVIGIMDHAPMFLLAVLAGALISMLGIVLLKKPLEKKTQIEKQ
ncbi:MULTISPECIES: PTS fructose transporter subunit IIABC [Lachnospiraceae]|uniref:Fructose-specific PTS transporter subunit EIIC n=1 Tax=Faecalicatena acetigenes TaxID=2981790 RepID=A0ABT2TBF9_9FIRM|nr:MULTISPECIES: PTS fructose transporter subunit IIABC [Lachnospiraceae]MCU6747619.1 fructose-specific PTS transporter subunit EIIC [Faecalicatena acetigenes]RGT73227.1 PTS fructose transporter subunit IIC [Ruminococcus sp. AF18-22]SCH99295.1 EIIABC-Fru [uncultured Clostridium sp.]